MERAAAKGELHHAIGLVYDSALDTAVWPAALEAMSGLIDGCYGAISIMDTEQRTLRFASEWCPDPEWPKWRKLHDERYAAIMPFNDTMHRFEVGSVYDTAQMAELSGMPAATIYEHPFFKEFALPAGRRDNIGCVLMRNRSRFGLFNIQTSVERDLITPRELAVGALLAPHVRRAVHICDVLDMVTMKAATLQSALDTVRAAVIVTDADARVMFANRAGDAMLQSRAPIGTQDGQLNAVGAAATAVLRTAIAQSQDPVTSIGANGIGVPLVADDGRHAIAHVLPLDAGGGDRDFGPRATAAVFIAPVEHALPEADALTALYGLTPMEARVLLQIASGKRRAEAAAALGIADSTAKTHLDRVYGKTGLGDQAALARLVASLGSPARWP